MESEQAEVGVSDCFCLFASTASTAQKYMGEEGWVHKS
jgi:hypothetical protein